MTSPTDEILLQALTGDRDAVETLINTHREPVMRGAIAGTWSGIDQKESLNVALFHIWQRFTQPSGHGGSTNLPSSAESIEGWLYQTAKNRAQDFSRQQLRTRSREPVAIEELPVTITGTLNSAMNDRTSMQETVRGAIQQLNESDRELLFLRYYIDLDSNQIADRIGYSLGNTNRLIAKARGNLAEILNRDIEDDR